jgi:copper chaperone CopZ
MVMAQHDEGGGTTDSQEKVVVAPAIHCEHCVMTIQRELGELDGIEEVLGDPDSQRVLVRWRAPATWARIEQVMTEAGFPPVP